MLSNVGKIFFCGMNKIIILWKIYSEKSVLTHTNILLFSLMFKAFSKVTFTHAYFQNSGSNIGKKCGMNEIVIFFEKIYSDKFCWHTNILLFSLRFEPFGSTITFNQA